MSLFKRNSPRFFLTRKETSQLVNRVADFEKETGCELVFHFRRTLGSNPADANKKLFHKFGLNQTSDHRAILVTLALKQRTYAIWADGGVESHAGRELHDKIGEHLKKHLSDGRHLEALVGVVDIATEALRNSRSKNHHKNEIPDEPIIE